MWQAQLAELGRHCIRNNAVLPEVLSCLLKLTQQMRIVYLKTNYLPLVQRIQPISIGERTGGMYGQFLFADA